MTIASLTSKFLVLAALLASIPTPAFSITLAGHLEQNYSAIARGAELTNGANMNASVRQDCFPESYEGSWRCETVVTDSAVESVTPGQKVICEVQFVKDATGKTVSLWNQDGWSEGQSSVTAFNNAEAQMDRTSFFTAQGGEGMWAARARGNYTQVNGAAIIARSVVDQYVDGRYVGRYHTTSILRRENPLEGVAASGEEQRDFIDQPVNALPVPAK